MGGNVPLGYEADGRTLKINEEEAETIRLIYDLYLQRGPVRAVKQELDQRGLKTPVRTASTGRRSGGVPFGIGHLHYILSNPVYAGKTRHKDKVYDGQHEAIIDEQIWTRVQQLLEGKAWNGSIRKRRAKHPSPLVGKLFDETGDRLTPSHANKRGVRYRYYVSNRLLKMPKRWQPMAGACRRPSWRRPSAMQSRTISRQQRLLAWSSSHRLRSLQNSRTGWTTCHTEKTDDADAAAAAPARWQGRYQAWPDGDQVVDAKRWLQLFDMKENRIRTDALHFTIPFRIRRKGVEAKFDTGKETP